MTVPLVLQLATRYAFAMHVPNFFQGLCQTVVVPLIPLICHENGYNDAVAGGLFALLGLGRFTCNAPTAVIAKKISSFTALWMASVVCMAGVALEFAASCQRWPWTVSCSVRMLRCTTADGWGCSP
jgi:predicted MFS family arabinose efflux permease